MPEDTLSVVIELQNNSTADVVELSTVQFVTYMIVGIPSWILYILVIILFIKPSNTSIFRHSYYRLALVIGLLVRL